MADTEMLLWPVKWCLSGLGGVEEPEQFTADVALEHADDLASSAALGGASGEVGAGAWVVAESG